MPEMVSFETPNDDFPKQGEMIKLRVVDEINGYDSDEWFLITAALVSKTKSGWRVDLQIAGAPRPEQVQ